MSSRITVAYGDGIGPEIMDATLRIHAAAGVALKQDVIEIGEKVYKAGHSSGIADSAWETILGNKVFLKAPITTPQGGGYKSLNVTIRKSLNLFANIRPCRAYAPFVPTYHPSMDLVIVRENEEDLYAGIEHRQTDEVYQCLKLVSYPGCERIIRYAFDYAVHNNRKKVSCFSKDNIMKITDGLFHKIFDEVAKDYPQIEKDHWIVDIGSARLANKPELFDVIVTENLYGDIISDIAAEIAGSVGMCGSANIGQKASMFEAIHGSAPDIAGQDRANPSGLLMGSLLMLNHLGHGEAAQKIHNAWLVTLEKGIHTGDIYSDSHSQQKVGTKGFAEAVIEHLGAEPEQFKPVVYKNTKPMILRSAIRPKPTKKELVGVDFFVHDSTSTPECLASKLETMSEKNKLKTENDF